MAPGAAVTTAAAPGAGAALSRATALVQTLQTALNVSDAARVTATLTQLKVRQPRLMDKRGHG